MPSHPASPGKRPRDEGSPASSGRPQKRRMLSPEEGELDESALGPGPSHKSSDEMYGPVPPLAAGTSSHSAAGNAKPLPFKFKPGQPTNGAGMNGNGYSRQHNRQQFGPPLTGANADAFAGPSNGYGPGPGRGYGPVQGFQQRHGEQRRQQRGGERHRADQRGDHYSPTHNSNSRDRDWGRDHERERQYGRERDRPYDNSGPVGERYIPDNNQHSRRRSQSPRRNGYGYSQNEQQTWHQDRGWGSKRALQDSSWPNGSTPPARSEHSATSERDAPAAPTGPPPPPPPAPSGTPPPRPPSHSPPKESAWPRPRSPGVKVEVKAEFLPVHISLPPVLTRHINGHSVFDQRNGLISPGPDTKPLVSPPPMAALVSPQPSDAAVMPPPHPVGRRAPLITPTAPRAHRTPLSVRPVDAPTPNAAPRPRPKLLEPPRRQRPHLERSAEQEHNTYKRIFVGSGKLDDYDKLEKVGEGTFGEVHKARRKDNHNTIVALKRIFMHNESEGMPVTALREIRILKALEHRNVLPLLDMIVARENPTAKSADLYMVFPYMDYDLAGLLENPMTKLTPSMIKFFMLQLLEGTLYIHKNSILHRDMKAANLLIEKSGRLIIADFGLARPFDAEDLPQDSRNFGTKFTNMVVTRWYRPPELLLGERFYTAAVDLWGIGCIFAEMFTRAPILKGNTDGHQFDLIVSLCGTPTRENWPNCPAWRGPPGFQPQEEVKYPDQWAQKTRRVKSSFNDVIPDAAARQLLDEFLVCDPAQRITAGDALQHDYFFDTPAPMKLGDFPAWAPAHEYNKRRHAPAPAPPPQQQPSIPPYMQQQNGIPPYVQNGRGRGHQHGPPHGRGGFGRGGSGGGGWGPGPPPGGGQGGWGTNGGPGGPGGQRGPMGQMGRGGPPGPPGIPGSQGYHGGSGPQGMMNGGPHRGGGRGMNQHRPGRGGPHNPPFGRGGAPPGGEQQLSYN